MPKLADMLQENRKRLELKYSVGRLLCPSPDDQGFDDERESEQAAIEASINDGVWAVWENETGEIMAIVYQQIAYH